MKLQGARYGLFSPVFFKVLRSHKKKLKSSQIPTKKGLLRFRRLNDFPNSRFFGRFAAGFIQFFFGWIELKKHWFSHVVGSDSLVGKLHILDLFWYHRIYFIALPKFDLVCSDVVAYWAYESGLYGPKHLTRIRYGRHLPPRSESTRRRTQSRSRRVLGWGPRSASLGGVTHPRCWKLFKYLSWHFTIIMIPKQFNISLHLARTIMIFVCIPKRGS